MDHTNNNKYKPSLRIKIISMGNAEVGKSCIIKRYCEKRFVSKYLTTIGIDYGVTKVKVFDKEVKVNIFDMAGHPIFYEVRNEFYKDTQGAMLMFDVCKESSFEALDMWMAEIKNEIHDDIKNITIVICANKSDKTSSRVIDEATGRLWAEKHDLHYFETSAQNGDGVNDMFRVLFEGILTTLDNGGRKPPRAAVQLGYNKEQIDAITRLRTAKNNHERLGIPHNAGRDEINKAFRRLSVLLHPDKSIAPGSEEAFKALVTARTDLLNTKS